MGRFVIRNYGRTRQFPYKDKQIYIANDKAIETDDVEMVAVLQNFPQMEVTDHCPETPGPSLPSPKVVPDEVEQTPDEVLAEVVESSDEIAYGDMSLKELQELGKDRQLKVSGLKKAELIVVLEDYDKAEVETPVDVEAETPVEVEAK